MHTVIAVPTVVLLMFPPILPSLLLLAPLAIPVSFLLLFNLLLTCSYRCCFIPGVPAMGVVSAAEPSLLQLSSLLPLAIPKFLAGVPVFCF
jgi:hypothetical protein